MLKIDRLLPKEFAAPPDLAELVLPFVLRSKSRLRTQLADGRDAGLLLPRGTVLRGGDLLQAEGGELIRVCAAPEPLYEVRARATSADPAFDLLRAAYHLGNRHVPVELEPDVLRLERDPVLRELLLRLGVEVVEIVASFEPEAGAYGGGHRHDHDRTGGALGERLSREAHGVFEAERSAAPHLPGAPWR